VDRVEPAARLVLELPDLDAVQRGVGDHVAEAAVDHVLPGQAANRPLAVLADELEPAGRDRVALLEQHDLVVCEQLGGDLVALGVGGLRGHVERHDVARRVEVDVVRQPEVLQDHALADLVVGEVDDHLVALGHAVAEARDRLRRGVQPAVAADHGHRAAAVEREVERAGHRRVEEPEAVLAPLDRHRRPRPPVDEDDVPEQAVLAVVVEDQRAAAREHRVLEHDRDVVAAVRDRQRLLELVVNHVHRGEPHVGVLGRVVDAVVVVQSVRAGSSSG
jgi:hypothetical protein